MYTERGLDLTMADNAVEAGIYRVWQRLSSGRLKVFKSLQQWFSEFRLYRRDEKGKVVTPVVTPPLTSNLNYRP